MHLTALIGRRLGNMTDLVFAVAVYVVGQITLFTLSLIAYLRWKVPVCDLAHLLRATTPVLLRRNFLE
jgi:hypothetical protein